MHKGNQAEATMIRRAVVQLNPEGKKEFVCYVKHEINSLHQCPEIILSADNFVVGTAVYVFAPAQEDRAGAGPLQRSGCIVK